MMGRVKAGIERVDGVGGLGCLLRRVEALVVYVGGPSASEVLALAWAACSPTAMARHNPQTSYNEYMPYLSPVVKYAEHIHERKQYDLNTFQDISLTSHACQAPTHADDLAGHIVPAWEYHYWQLICFGIGLLLFAILQLTFLLARFRVCLA